MIKMERYRTGELKTSSRTLRTGIEQSNVAKTALKVVSVLGVSLIMSDGVLTPAQSVLGAIQGLHVVSPGISTSVIIGVSCAILVLLFLIQPLGTSKIASTFAPIVIIWLLFNAAFGVYNLALFDHSVLKAFSPYFAGAYLVRTGTDGWKSLGGILLAFTGNSLNQSSWIIGLLTVLQAWKPCLPTWEPLVGGLSRSVGYASAFPASYWRTLAKPRTLVSTHQPIRTRSSIVLPRGCFTRALSLPSWQLSLLHKPLLLQPFRYGFTNVDSY